MLRVGKDRLHNSDERFLLRHGAAKWARDMVGPLWVVTRLSQRPSAISICQRFSLQTPLEATGLDFRSVIRIVRQHLAPHSAASSVHCSVFYPYHHHHLLRRWLCALSASIPSSHRWLSLVVSSLYLPRTAMVPFHQRLNPG